MREKIRNFFAALLNGILSGANVAIDVLCDILNDWDFDG